MTHFKIVLLQLESINCVETHALPVYLTYDDKVEVHNTIESDAYTILANIIVKKEY